MLLIVNELDYGKQFASPWALEPRWQAKFGRWTYMRDWTATFVVMEALRPCGADRNIQDMVR